MHQSKRPIERPINGVWSSWKMMTSGKMTKNDDKWPIKSLEKNEIRINKDKT